MLKQLSIQNYALIDQLEMSPEEGLSIITGETGAGKSILLGAMSLILGERANTSVLFNSEKKCIVEGIFNIKAYGLHSYFNEHDLDYDDETIIRRQINSSGKSRAFVNDMPVRLNVLKDLGKRLVDIHSQHQTLQLNNREFHVNVLDAFAGQLKDVQGFSGKYHSLKNLQGKLEGMLEQEKKAKADEDYFRFQLNELEEAHLKEGEKEELEKELEMLENSEEIQESISLALGGLNRGEENLLSLLNEIYHNVARGSTFYKPLEEIRDRLNSAKIEIEDLSNELDRMDVDAGHDPVKREEVSERLSTIYDLEQKHRVSSESELIQLQEDLAQKVSDISTLDDEIEELKKEIEKEQEALLKEAAKLSARRKKNIPGLQKKIKSIVKDLGMPEATLEVRLQENTELSNKGTDRIEFYFSANKGASPQPIHKIASGGELSRLMLSIKSVLAESTSLPSIIFDEIDTGVSGEVADKVGNILKKMGDNMQVLAISHLPQIAAKGAAHYKVYKKTVGKMTYSNIEKLDKEERVEEVAKMLSGDKVSQAAFENARTLLKA